MSYLRVKYFSVSYFCKPHTQCTHTHTHTQCTHTHTYKMYTHKHIQKHKHPHTNSLTRSLASPDTCQCRNVFADKQTISLLSQTEYNTPPAHQPIFLGGSKSDATARSVYTQSLRFTNTLATVPPQHVAAVYCLDFLGYCYRSTLLTGFAH